MFCPNAREHYGIECQHFLLGCSEYVNLYRERFHDIWRKVPWPLNFFMSIFRQLTLHLQKIELSLSLHCNHILSLS